MNAYMKASPGFAGTRPSPELPDFGHETGGK
jgi:hypothetical protein